MRKFSFYEPDDNGSAKEVIKTEEEIKENYYPYWKNQMIKKGFVYYITFEKCLEDWINVHWAEEIKDE